MDSVRYFTIRTIFWQKEKTFILVFLSFLFFVSVMRYVSNAININIPWYVSDWSEMLVPLTFCNWNPHIFLNAKIFSMINAENNDLHGMALYTAHQPTKWTTFLTKLILKRFTYSNCNHFIARWSCNVATWQRNY